MPTLAERRAAQAAGQSYKENGEFIAFKTEGETRILRFLFNDENDIEVHRKYFDEATKQWVIDGDQGSYRIVFNCVEYDKGGKNPRRVRWEVSQYLYDSYLSPYIEKNLPASKGVWEISVRRPKTTDVSYVAFPVEGANDIDYPIPEATGDTSDANDEPPFMVDAPKPGYVDSGSTSGQAPAAPASTTGQAPAQPQPTTGEAPRKSKYFEQELIFEEC